MDVLDEGLLRFWKVLNSCDVKYITVKSVKSRSESTDLTVIQMTLIFG